MSLGKTNYCLKALIDKGWVKAGNFSRSQHKHRYLYQLTPAGIAEKARITGRFLKRKIAEHEALTREIEQLRREAAEGSGRRAQGSERRAQGSGLRVQGSGTQD